jgi:AcrR family transcriptional regulator
VEDLAKVEFPANTTNGRSRKRRGRILRALHDCVIEKGYAKTTLADVARVAGMSSSHLLYYFRGKDAILERYFEEMARRLLERVDGFRESSLERQIELLAELFFAGKAMSTSEIGFMLECFGAAVHDEKLHEEKSDLDRAFKNYLADLFRLSPGCADNAQNTAEIAYSLLIGLLTVAFFDKRLGLPQARTLFSAEMGRLANLDQ